MVDGIASEGMMLDGLRSRRGVAATINMSSSIDTETERLVAHVDGGSSPSERATTTTLMNSVSSVEDDNFDVEAGTGGGAQQATNRYYIWNDDSGNQQQQQQHPPSSPREMMLALRNTNSFFLRLVLLRSYCRNMDQSLWTKAVLVFACCSLVTNVFIMVFGVIGFLAGLTACCVAIAVAATQLRMGDLECKFGMCVRVVYFIPFCTNNKSLLCLLAGC